MSMKILRRDGVLRVLAHALVALAIGSAAADDDVFPTHEAPAPVPAPRRPPPVADSPAPAPAAPVSTAYLIRPGDLLTITVWKETDLVSEVTVRPDGGFSFPLAGDVQAVGHSVEEVRILLGQRLRKYLSDPVVTVAVKTPGGSRVYVVGKVNRPGDFPLGGPIDVIQALGLAGGATPFADLNDIQIIRRDGGEQQAIRFRYHDIERGKHLEQNILLHPGDTVVVP